MSEYHDEDGFTCHALVGGTVPMRIDTRYHALLLLSRSPIHREKTEIEENTLFNSVS